MPEGTHGFGDTVGDTVSFNESVTVTATGRRSRPPMLAIGTSVWAEWLDRSAHARSAAHGVHRRRGGLEADRTAIKATSIETSSGSSIRTIDATEEIALGHAGSFDGVLRSRGVGQSSVPKDTFRTVRSSKAPHLVVIQKALHG